MLVLTGSTWAVEALADVAPVHHIATVRIDPAQNQIDVVDTLTLTAQGLTHFRLSSTFKVSSAKVDGTAVSFSRTQDRLSLRLKGPHTVELSYASRELPSLDDEGGFIDPDWLAQPDDRLATWGIKGSVPNGQKFVVPGRLVDETETDGGYTAQFESLTPSASPILITGPYHVHELMANGVRLRTYFHAELAALANDYLNDTAGYIDGYAATVGPYPYPGFFILSATHPVGWGLPGMTYMGRRVLALPFIRTTSLPHEILHNWWGNAVEVDYQKGNWAEGLTTYQADHAMAEKLRPGAAQEMRQEWLRNYAALPRESDQALSAFRSKTHDASQVVGYGKAAFVFHMLKTQWGENVFNKALQRFNRDNTRKVAGWADIKAAFEAETQQNLSAFFSAWIERSGAPELTLSDATNTDGVRFTLKQIQDGLAYPLNIPIDIETPQGIQRHVVNLVTKSQTFSFATSAKATAVRVDPDTDVFLRLNAADMPPILRDITLDPTAQVVVLGDGVVQELGTELAQSLLQPADPGDGDKTVLIVGLQAPVRTYLAQHHLPAVPERIAAQGDARAWTARDGAGRTLLVAEALDADGLKALTRVLPHYKKRSYVIMQDGQTFDKGTWPAKLQALTVHFE
ncbi:hypothetical protein BEN30_06750 [Magnetovibrio blakemorei]|uniref:Peptidase M1 membrane alanine aminopeptidase domain-containing protein n=1 Tax=Magnetovibrio blakemorei TaxID=28181 RepID=A0A1E5Q9R8_9PROT|nr:hypothetical protein BEN30_06750 [Magnetovibrio blakemorei]